MTWETVQSIEIVWLTLALLAFAVLAFMLIRGIRLWRQTVPYNGAALIQASINIAKFATLLTGSFGGILLVVPQLFLAPRVDLDPSYWARVGGVVAPIGAMLLLLSIVVDAILLLWMQHVVDDYFISEKNRMREADILLGRTEAREQVADMREKLADKRDHLAEQRELLADERDLSAGAREVEMADVKADTVSIKADTVLLVEHAEAIDEEKTANGNGEGK